MGGVGVDRKYSQTSQDEWEQKGWSNSVGLPARGNISFTETPSRPLNIIQVPGEPDDDSSALAEHRSLVYHKGLLEILRSVIPAAGKDGFTFNDGTGEGCFAQLIISVLSMDYEEGWVIITYLSIQ